MGLESRDFLDPRFIEVGRQWLIARGVLLLTGEWRETLLGRALKTSFFRRRMAEAGADFIRERLGQPAPSARFIKKGDEDGS